jgi:hypothetical protein
VFAAANYFTQNLIHIVLVCFVTHHRVDDRLMTVGGTWQSMQPQPIVPMSFFKQNAPTRSASKDQFGRIHQPESKGRFHWRFVPGSRAALELAHDAESLDENNFLPGPMVGRVRRKART